MKKDIEFPECWEEVMPPEWSYLLKLRAKLEKKRGITLLDIKREWCRFVLKLRGASVKTTRSYLLVNRLAQTLDWMWRMDQDNEVVELTFDSTDNLLPKWRTFRGPKSHGADMTFGEFRAAMNMMNAYTQTHDAKMLCGLVGILYRKSGDLRKGEYREPFRQEMISLYASRVYGMEDWLKWGVYAWFSSFCRYLVSGTFIIDGNEVSFEPLFRRSSDDTSADQSLGLNSILFSVAESGVFGNINSTDGTLLHRVLLKLLDDHYKVQALLKQTKQ